MSTPQTPDVTLEFVLVRSNGNDVRTLAGWLADGSLKPHVSKTFAFDNLGDAHRQIESGRTVGKIVVTT